MSRPVAHAQGTSSPRSVSTRPGCGRGLAARGAATADRGAGAASMAWTKGALREEDGGGLVGCLVAWFWLRLLACCCSVVEVTLLLVAWRDPVVGRACLLYVVCVCGLGQASMKRVCIRLSQVRVFVADGCCSSYSGMARRLGRSHCTQCKLQGLIGSY